MSLVIESDKTLFKGKIEVVVEADNKKEAEETLKKIAEGIIKDNKYIYRTRYEMPKEEVEETQ